MISDLLDGPFDQFDWLASNPETALVECAVDRERVLSSVLAPALDVAAEMFLTKTAVVAGVSDGATVVAAATADVTKVDRDARARAKCIRCQITDS